MYHYQKNATPDTFSFSYYSEHKAKEINKLKFLNWKEKSITFVLEFFTLRGYVRGRRGRESENLSLKLK